jgi:hypothetical protein
MTRMRPQCTIIAVVVVLGTPVSGWPCSCFIEPSATKSLAGVEEVFTGRVIAVKRPYADAVIQSSMDPVLVTMAVDRVWKGAVGPVVELTTVSDGASCGFGFAANERYLVFTNDRFVSLCSRTSLLEHAASDLAALGAGREPDTAAPPRRPRPSATPGEPDATGYERCPDGVATISEPFVGFLDLDRLTGTYDMGCEDDCSLTHCDVTPREGPVVTRYANGQMHIRGFYRHGRREGAWDSWYRDGRPHYAVFWRHDQAQGLWRIWYDSGQMEAEMEFTDGVPDGEWLFWHANGNPSIEGAHRHGARSGTWRLWDETGKLLTEGPGGAAPSEP